MYRRYFIEIKQKDNYFFFWGGWGLHWANLASCYSLIVLLMSVLETQQVFEIHLKDISKACEQ